MKIDEVEYKGFNIEIHTDDEGESPREWDNLGTMVCFHKNYSLGDEHEYAYPVDFVYDLLLEYDLESDRVNDDFNVELTSGEFVEKYLDKLDKQCIILPIYLYDHSGLTINTSGFSCRWDSMQIGWIYVTYEKIKKEYGWKHVTKDRRRKIEEYLRQEVKTYDQRLTGEVYGYNIKAKDNNTKIECEDSCSGFYGYDLEESGLLPEARSNIDYAIKDYKKAVKDNKYRKNTMNEFINTCWAF